jgi:hypothetical protein
LILAAILLVLSSSNLFSSLSLLLKYFLLMGLNRYISKRKFIYDFFLCSLALPLNLFILLSILGFSFSLNSYQYIL